MGINKPNKAINQSGLSVDNLSAINRMTPEQKAANESGVSCGKKLEPLPYFIEAPCEQITYGPHIKGQNNTTIVLGRDRPAGLQSGYGGKGDTQCGMIDMCVGRMSPNPKELNSEGERVYVSNMLTTEAVPPEISRDEPKIQMDAARIYISQKTDVDHNFSLAPGTIGSPGPDQSPRSAIALQADGIRIIGRESIKLVTHGPGNPSGIYNSQGGLLESVGGIDLIAGNNDEDLQPMVKGYNMVQCIQEIFEQLDKLNGIVSGILASQMKYNTVLASHVHHSPFFGLPTTPSQTAALEGLNTLTRQLTQSIASITAQKTNLTFLETAYTNDAGAFYILSSYNNTN